MYSRRISSACHLAATAIAIFGLLIGSSVAAQSDRSPSEAAKMESKLSERLYSPFCPGKSLEMCPSPSAAELRREIQSLAEKGLSEKEIEQKLLSEYEDIKMTPPPASTNYSLFIALAVGLIAVISFVTFLLRGDTDTTSPATDASTDTPEDDLYREELRDEYR